MIMDFLRFLWGLSLAIFAEQEFMELKRRNRQKRHYSVEHVISTQTRTRTPAWQQ